MTMFERLERLEQRIGALEASKVELGPLEHRDLVALDRHFDGRCDYLSKRVDELVEHLESIKESLETARGDYGDVTVAAGPGDEQLVSEPRYIPWVDPLLKEALKILQAIVDVHGDDLNLAGVEKFLARARVATKEP